MDNVEGAQKELLKYWSRVSSNRWLLAKMFGVLVGLPSLQAMSMQLADMMFLDDILPALGVDRRVVFWVVPKITILLYNYVLPFLTAATRIRGLPRTSFFFDVRAGVFSVESFVASMVDRTLVIMMGGRVVFFVSCFLGRQRRGLPEWLCTEKGGSEAKGARLSLVVLNGKALRV